VPTRRPVSHPHRRSLRPRVAPVLVAALYLTIAAPVRAQDGKEPAGPPRPLAHFAAMHLIVLPTQFLGVRDSAGLGASLASPREYLGGLDTEIEFAIKDRLRTTWVFPAALVRSARMNPTFGSDPYAASSDELRSEVSHKKPEISQPLASELRNMIALQDEARYALVPAELRFEPVKLLPAGAAAAARTAKDSAAASITRMRGLLRVTLIDCRASVIVFSVDIPSDTLSTVSPALRAQIASRLADLIAPPAR
jgi:hypothetical protein